MQNLYIIIGLGVILLLGLTLLYFVWPYLIGILALIGAMQVYRLWRQHSGR